MKPLKKEDGRGRMMKRQATIAALSPSEKSAHFAQQAMWRKATKEHQAGDFRERRHVARHIMQQTAHVEKLTHARLKREHLKSVP